MEIENEKGALKKNLLTEVASGRLRKRCKRKENRRGSGRPSFTCVSPGV